MGPSVVLTWGANSSGQCCSGKDGPKVEQQPRVVNAVLTRSLSVATPIAAVAAGEAHTLLLTAYGDVYACGRAREGQLGLGVLGDSTEVWVPTRIEALRPWRITQVACGSMHSVAVTADGGAFEWGLLLPTTRPSEDEVWAAKRHGMGRDFMEDLSQRQQRIVADSWSRYLKNAASEGKAGHELPSGAAAMEVLSSSECHRIATHLPRECLGLEGLRVLAIVCGFAHSVAACAGGKLLAAGYGEKGQLGNGDRFPSARFIMVKLPAGCTAAAADAGCKDSDRTLQLSCGLNHTAAIAAPRSELLVWGLGVFGQLGLGHGRKEQCLPTAVPLPSEALQVACGDHHTVVLTADGAVWTFGHRDAVGGQSHVHRCPERKPGLSRCCGQEVETIFAGGTGCFALVKTAAAPEPVLQAWGYNQRFQLGRSTAMLQLQQPGPAALPRLAGAHVRAFSAGANHCVAVVDAPSSCVLPPEVGEPFFGSAPLLSALRGESPFDVAVLSAGQSQEPLGAHRSVLYARCPQLAAALRRAERPFGVVSWELDLGLSSRPCVAALLEYLYTDHCRASISVAAELQNLAQRLGLERLRAGAASVTETSSMAEGQRWVRNAEGRWAQVKEVAETSECCASTYYQDLDALVIEGPASASAEEGDYLELRIREGDGGVCRTVHAARALLLTVDFFRACLAGEFAEAANLRSGTAAEIAADSAEAMVLCLRLLATGDYGLLPESAADVLAVLTEAHRLELPDIVAAAESALDHAAFDCEDAELRAALQSAAELYNLPKVVRNLNVDVAARKAAQPQP